MTAWRDHAGFLAWPTVLLALAIWVGVAATWAGVASGWLPRIAGSAIMTGLVYAAFTPMHEAAHGNVGGSKRLARLDDAVGWACSLLFLAPFPAFKAVHLRHHGTVNQAGKDPDLWVAGSKALSIAGRCLTIIPHYYVSFLGPMAAPTKANRRARAVSVAALSLQAVAAAAVGWQGFGWDLLTLWLLPSWLASGLLAFAFDWLPHHPHGDTGRWTNARVLNLPGLTLPLLGQNYHLVHHLWPRVPFYRYAALFRATEGELVAHGAPVVSTAARPVRP